MFSEEMNPEIMNQELAELTGMDMDELRYESYGYDCLSPEEKVELQEWFEWVDSLQDVEQE